MVHVEDDGGGPRKRDITGICVRRAVWGMSDAYDAGIVSKSAEERLLNWRYPSSRCLETAVLAVSENRPDDAATNT